MACNCGKKKGKTPETALVFGPNGDAPRHVESTVTNAPLGLHAGKQMWVTGRDVDAMIDKGWIKVIESPAT